MRKFLINIVLYELKIDKKNGTALLRIYYITLYT